MNSPPASAKVGSAGGRITSEVSSSASPTSRRCSRTKTALAGARRNRPRRPLHESQRPALERVQLLAIAVVEAILVLSRRCGRSLLLSVGSGLGRRRLLRRAPAARESRRRCAGRVACADFTPSQFGQLVVHRRLARELPSAGGRCRLRPSPVLVTSSNVPAASSSGDGIRAGLHVFRLVHRALHRKPDIGHLLADARRGLGDPHLGLGGRVLRLDDLLLGAEGLDLGAQFLLESVRLLLLGFKFCDLRVQPLELRLSDVLALQRRSARSSLPAATAWRACVSSLTTLCCSELSCICRRFFAVTTSAMPFLTFCSCSTCFW